MTQHTQGEWIYDCGNDGAVVYIRDVGTIANVPDAFHESEANARLIAAAPKLLEALEKVIDWHVPQINPGSDAAILLAKAAIAAAKGE